MNSLNEIENDFPIPDVEWKTEKRFIKDLIPHPRNPRSLSKRMHNKLADSLKKYNYAEIVAINKDNMILAGHQRIYVMKDIGWGDKEIEVRVPSRKLTKKESDNYLLISNKVSGDWDFDIMADQWEEEELFEGGFLKEEIYGKEEENSINVDDTDLEMEERLVVEIECKDHKSQKDLYEELIKRGLKCRLLSL